MAVFYCYFFKTDVILLTTPINFAYKITMTEQELKLEFARSLLKNPNDPFKAALMVFPDDNGLALQIASKWPVDKEVINLKKDLIETEGELSFLPGPAEQAKALWDRMSKCHDNIEYVRLSKLYADIMGHIKTAGSDDGNTTGNIFDEISKIVKV